MFKKICFILLAIAAMVPFTGQITAATQDTNVQSTELAWWHGGHGGWGWRGGWGGWRGGWGGYPYYYGGYYYPYYRPYYYYNPYYSGYYYT